MKWRVLGAPRAPERLQALDRMLSFDEKAKPVELAKSIRNCARSRHRWFFNMLEISRRRPKATEVLRRTQARVPI